MLLEKIEQSSDIKKLKEEDYPILQKKFVSSCWKRSVRPADILRQTLV